MDLREQLEDEFFPSEYTGIVLYGDMAPMYEEAYKAVKRLEYDNSMFVIVGTSFYTGISADLKRIAEQRKAKILLINSNAATRIPKLCEQLKRSLNGERVVLDSDVIENNQIYGSYKNNAWEW